MLKCFVLFFPVLIDEVGESFYHMYMLIMWSDGPSSLIRFTVFFTFDSCLKKEILKQIFLTDEINKL